MIPTIPTDRFVPDRRGVSEVIGAVLIFALVLLMLAIIQVAAVPIANQQAEFEHNQRVTGDFQDLSGAVDRAATLNTPGTTSVEAGFRYRSRLFLINPPSPSGGLETEPGTFVVRNAIATNAETRDYLNGGDQTFDTNALVYRPNYNEYRNSPVTRYEGWTLFNQYDGGDRVYNRKGLVTDRRVALTALDGGRSGAAPGAITIEVSPISTPRQSVGVTGEGPDDPVTLELTTELPAETWEGILSDQANVDAVNQLDADTVEVVLAYADQDGTPIAYDLRLAKVGIGTGTTDEGPHYLTTTGPLPQITTVGGTISVEARDRFNAPIAGEPVEFTATGASLRTSDGEVGSTVTATTNEEGQASVAVVNPTGSTVDVTATADVAEGTDGRQTERGTVTYADLEVGGDSDEDGEFNPDDADSVKLISSEIIGSGAQQNKEPYYVDVTFQNQAPDTKTITAIRVNAYLSNTFSQAQGTIVPDEVRIDAGNLLEVGGPYATPGGTFDTTLAPGDESTYRFEFLVGGSNHQPDRADVIVYSVRFTDGSSGRYFVQTDNR